MKPLFAFLLICFATSLGAQTYYYPPVGSRPPGPPPPPQQPPPMPLPPQMRPGAPPMPMPPNSILPTFQGPQYGSFFGGNSLPQTYRLGMGMNGVPSQIQMGFQMQMGFAQMPFAQNQFTRPQMQFPQMQFQQPQFPPPPQTNMFPSLAMPPMQMNPAMMGINNSSLPFAMANTMAMGMPHMDSGSSFCASCSLRRESLTPTIALPPPTPDYSRFVPNEGTTEARLNLDVPPPSAAARDSGPVPRSGQDRVASADSDNSHIRTTPTPQAARPAAARRAGPAGTPPSTARTQPRVAAAASSGTAAPQQRHPLHTPRSRTLTPNEEAGVRARTQDERRAIQSPIWPEFIKDFQQCMPGCVPYDFAAYGTRNRLSCHTSGRAIDVRGIVCGGGTPILAIQQGKFNQLMACMAKKMHTIYHNKPYSPQTVTSGHWDHGHFSLGCQVTDQNNKPHRMY